MSLYQRGKSWYYDFHYRGERYAGCIGAVSKTVAKEILTKKKAEAVEGRYELPSAVLTKVLCKRGLLWHAHVYETTYVCSSSDR